MVGKTVFGRRACTLMADQLSRFDVPLRSVMRVLNAGSTLVQKGCTSDLFATREQAYADLSAHSHMLLRSSPDSPIGSLRVPNGWFEERTYLASNCETCHPESFSIFPPTSCQQDSSSGDLVVCDLVSRTRRRVYCYLPLWTVSLTDSCL
jgi:hypothetical protein